MATTKKPETISLDEHETKLEEARTTAYNDGYYKGHKEAEVKAEATDAAAFKAGEMCGIDTAWEVVDSEDAACQREIVMDPKLGPQWATAMRELTEAGWDQYRVVVLKSEK